MAACSYCNSYILFGGEKIGNQRFCNEKCATYGQLLLLSEQIPYPHVYEFVQRLHQGHCPKCNGHGPVEVFTAYRVWSALALTSWINQPQICCKKCGLKSQAYSLSFSLLLGWWGIPFGLIMTPVQIVRNLAGMCRTPDSSRPSQELVRLARIHLASQLAVAQQYTQVNHPQRGEKWDNAGRRLAQFYLSIKSKFRSKRS
jgi:hypothetical protein